MQPETGNIHILRGTICVRPRDNIAQLDDVPGPNVPVVVFVETSCPCFATLPTNHFPLLRQRLTEDVQLRCLAPTTQPSYIHYVAGFARFFNTSPEKIDLEAVRPRRSRRFVPAKPMRSLTITAKIELFLARFQSLGPQ